MFCFSTAQLRCFLEKMGENNILGLVRLSAKVTLYCHSFKVKAHCTDITRTFVDCVFQSCLWRIDRRETRVLNVGTILVNGVRGWWDYEKAANSKSEIISNICYNRLMPETSIAHLLSLENPIGFIRNLKALKGVSSKCYRK